MVTNETPSAPLAVVLLPESRRKYLGCDPKANRNNALGEPLDRLYANLGNSTRMLCHLPHASKIAISRKGL